MIAQYHNTDVFQGNPYVEALPPMLTGDKLANALSVFPEYEETDRDKPIGARLQLLSNLMNFYQPLPMTFTLYSQIYLNMQRSFGQHHGKVGKRELIQGYQHLAYQEAFVSGGGGNSFSVVGVSGLGKSVTIQRIMSLFPRSIEHREYDGQPFCNIQIPYLIIQTPHDCSVKAMCMDILIQVDEIAGTEYYKSTVGPHLSADLLISKIAQISRCLHIGMLIVDEIQNLAYNNGTYGIRFLNFLVQLINASSLSICLIGTPQAHELLRKEFRSARRATGLLFDRLKNDEEFKLLANGLWHYQYTKKATPLTPEILQWLYRKSQGIPDILSKLIYFGQHYAIMSGREILDIRSLEHALEENLYILDGFISRLDKQTKKNNKISYSDIIIPVDTTQPNQVKNQVRFVSLYKKAQRQQISCEILLQEYIKDEVEIC